MCYEALMYSVYPLNKVLPKSFNPESQERFFLLLKSNYFVDRNSLKSHVKIIIFSHQSKCQNAYIACICIQFGDGHLGKVQENEVPKICYVTFTDTPACTVLVMSQK